MKRQRTSADQRKRRHATYLRAYRMKCLLAGLAAGESGSSKNMRFNGWVTRSDTEFEVNNTSLIVDQTVADVVEALLGAMYLDKRENSTLLVAKRLNIPFTAVNSWSEFSNIAPPINSHYQLPPQALQTVQKIIGYQFKHSALLAEALVGSSLPYNVLRHSSKSSFRPIHLIRMQEVMID